MSYLIVSVESLPCHSSNMHDPIVDGIFGRIVSQSRVIICMLQMFKPKNVYPSMVRCIIRVFESLHLALKGPSLQVLYVCYGKNVCVGACITKC